MFFYELQTVWQMLCWNALRLPFYLVLIHMVFSRLQFRKRNLLVSSRYLIFCLHFNRRPSFVLCRNLEIAATVQCYQAQIATLASVSSLKVWQIMCLLWFISVFSWTFLSSLRVKGSVGNEDKIYVPEVTIDDIMPCTCCMHISCFNSTYFISNV
jgi:hypothetical protein